MPGLLQKILLLAMAALSFSSFASDITEISKCHLKGTIQLDRWTQVYCDSDLVIDDGTRIVTNGFKLNIASAGSLVLKGSFQIVAFDGAPSVNSNAELVTIDSEGTATGHLIVQNCGKSARDLGEDVELKFMTVDHFTLDLTLDQAHSEYRVQVDNHDQTVHSTDCAAQ